MFGGTTILATGLYAARKAAKWYYQKNLYPDHWERLAEEERINEAQHLMAFGGPTWKPNIAEGAELLTNAFNQGFQ